MRLRKKRMPIFFSKDRAAKESISVEDVSELAAKDTKILSDHPGDDQTNINLLVAMANKCEIHNQKDPLHGSDGIVLEPYIGASTLKKQVMFETHSQDSTNCKIINVNESSNIVSGK